MKSNTMRIIIAVAMAALCTACALPKVVTVTEYRDRVQHDTVTDWRTDSVIKTRYVYVQADTVHDVQVLEHVRWRDRVRVEYTQVTDSVPYPVEVQVPVRVRNGYDYFTSWGFWILFILMLGIVALRFWLLRRGK